MRTSPHPRGLPLSLGNKGWFFILHPEWASVWRRFLLLGNSCFSSAKPSGHVCSVCHGLAWGPMVCVGRELSSVWWRMVRFLSKPACWGPDTAGHRPSDGWPIRFPMCLQETAQGAAVVWGGLGPRGWGVTLICLESGLTESLGFAYLWVWRKHVLFWGWQLTNIRLFINVFNIFLLATLEFPLFCSWYWYLPIVSMAGVFPFCWCSQRTMFLSHWVFFLSSYLHINHTDY